MHVRMWLLVWGYVQLTGVKGSQADAASILKTLPKLEEATI